MKKALIITYYWPPSGGSGVQRWLKFVKYLPSFDVQPVVLTVDEKKASYSLLDPSLSAEVSPDLPVYRTSTSEIYSLYKAIGLKKEIPHSGFANEGNPTLFQKISRFIRGNLFIPDPRIGWNRFAYEQAAKIITSEKIDCIITSSPPHSTQVIGLMLKKRFNLPWIADLRDPWTDIYYYRSFYHLPYAKKADRSLEKKVLETADAVVVVSERIKKLFLGKSGAIRPDALHVIPNGYDEVDFGSSGNEPGRNFEITYTGTLSDDYDISAFLSALKDIAGSGRTDFLVRFIGKISAKWQVLVERSGLASFVQFTDHIPHRDSVMAVRNSSLLLLVIPRISNNEGILTGKLFEYLAARRPILCMGPGDGDAAGIIRECDAGSVFDYGDRDGIRQFLLEKMTGRSSGDRTPCGNGAHARYERKSLTGLLGKVIRQLCP